MPKFLSLILFIFLASPVQASMPILEPTAARVVHIVSPSTIRVQHANGDTALVRIHGVPTHTDSYTHHEHALAFLRGSVLGREAILLHPEGYPVMQRRLNIMDVYVGGQNIAERINGATITERREAFPAWPNRHHMRYFGQLFVRFGNGFRPHFPGDSTQGLPLYFFYDGEFFRFRPETVTQLFFHSNGHFYPYFSGVNMRFTGSLYYLDNNGNHQVFIPGVSEHIGPVFTFSAGSYTLYNPWGRFAYETHPHDLPWWWNQANPDDWHLWGDLWGPWDNWGPGDGWQHAQPWHSWHGWHSSAWHSRLFFRDGTRYVAFLPGVTEYLGDIFILQGHEFVPFTPRFSGPAAGEYFHFDENFFGMYSPPRPPNPQPEHIRRLYYFDWVEGRFLPFYQAP